MRLLDIGKVGCRRNSYFIKELTSEHLFCIIHIQTLVLRKKDSGWQCYTTHNCLKYMHNVLTNRTTSTNINIYWKFFQGTGVLFFTFFYINMEVEHENKNETIHVQT